MCPSSITKRVCFDDKCQLTHIKGTKRRKAESKDNVKLPKLQNALDSTPVTNIPASKNSPMNKKAPVPSKVSNNSCELDSLHSSNASFLDMISLLKKELCEAMDQKIAQSLSQIHPFSPQMQHQRPYRPNLMHQPMSTFPYHPQFPQFPPMLNRQQSQ